MSVEITVPIRVTLVVADTAETASFDEVRVWLGRHANLVARAVEVAIGALRTVTSIGWLDEDNELFIEGLTGVDASAIRRSGAALDVFVTES